MWLTGEGVNPMKNFKNAWASAKFSIYEIALLLESTVHIHSNTYTPDTHPVLRFRSLSQTNYPTPFGLYIILSGVHIKGRGFYEDSYPVSLPFRSARP